jgi:hypothetical protein
LGRFRSGVGSIQVRCWVDSGQVLGRFRSGVGSERRCWKVRCSSMKGLDGDGVADTRSAHGGQTGGVGAVRRRSQK